MLERFVLDEFVGAVGALGQAREGVDEGPRRQQRAGQRINLRGLPAPPHRRPDRGRTAPPRRLLPGMGGQLPVARVERGGQPLPAAGPSPPNVKTNISKIIFFNYF